MTRHRHTCGQVHDCPQPDSVAGSSYEALAAEVTELRATVQHLRRFQRLVTDLDRNENGRHEGDADVGDPTGVSQGNPYVRTGEVLGYSIAGAERPYVMPERGKRHDPEAWGAL